MPKIEVFDSTGKSAAAVEFLAYLNQRGLESELASRRLRLLKPSATIAFLGTHSPASCFALGKRTGENVPLLIVAKEPLKIPELSAVLQMRLDEPNLFQRLHVALMQALGSSTGLPELPETGERLLKWLQEDWDRLDLLDSNRLMNVIDLVFTRSGFSTRRGEVGDEINLLVEGREPHVKWFVECKAHHLKHRFDLGDVRSACDSWAAREANFGLIVTNTIFTSAARSWASQAVPAVHLVDRNTLRSALMMLDTLEIKGELAKLFGAFAHEEPPLDHARHQVSQWHGRICLVVGEQREEERAHELMSTMSRHFEDADITVLTPQSASPHDTWRRSLAEAGVVVFVPSSEEQRPLWRDRHLQLLGHLCRPEMGAKSFVVFAEDSALNRMSVPTCMQQSIFVDSTGAMIASVRRQLQRSRRRGSPEE